MRWNFLYVSIRIDNGEISLGKNLRESENKPFPPPNAA